MKQIIITLTFAFTLLSSLNVFSQTNASDLEKQYVYSNIANVRDEN